MLAHPRGRGLQTHGTYHAHTHRYTHTTDMAHRCHIHRWPCSVSPVGGFSVSGEQGLSVGTPTSKAPAGLLGPLLAVAPAGLGTSPSCSSVAVSLRSSSIPHFGLGLFQPLPHFQLPPVSAALIFCLLEWAPGQGPSLELRPCTPVIQPSAHLRTAPCPASLLWPQHLALCPGTASTRGDHYSRLLLQPPQPLLLPPGGWPAGWPVGRPQRQDTCPGLRQKPCSGRRATLARPNSVPWNPWSKLRARLLCWATRDSQPIPWWAKEPSSEQESRGSKNVSSFQQNRGLPTMKWKGPCTPISPSVGPQGRVCPGRGSEIRGHPHSYGSCQHGS